METYYPRDAKPQINLIEMVLECTPAAFAPFFYSRSEHSFLRLFIRDLNGLQSCAMPPMPREMIALTHRVTNGLLRPQCIAA